MAGLSVAIWIASRRLRPSSSCSGEFGVLLPQRDRAGEPDRPSLRASSLLPASEEMSRVRSVENNFRLFFQDYDATVRHPRDRLARRLADDDAAVARWFW